jgi:spore germination cell wall hydrolase CwlJ-like protein
MKKIILYICFFLICNIAYGDRFYTPKEVVASVICAEAIGEKEIGMYAVSNVIANRARKWDMTPYEVVTQKNQFYGYTNKNKEELYNQGKEYCDYLAENIMTLSDRTNKALYFRKVDEEKESWHQVVTIKIKNHIFYK